jgi:hypothetical protein
MPDFDQVGEIKARVQGRLFGIPGVHAVGVGHKIVNGQRTDDVAIMVFVVKKKPLEELSPEDAIPPEIEGVKTDVYESDVPRTYADERPYRPLVGGVQVQAGGFIQALGTLGFFVRKDGAAPKIFAVTCHHVVRAVDGMPTELQVDASDSAPTITFSGTNTPGTLAVVKLTATPHGAPATPRFDLFYVTTAADTLDSIAANMLVRINALGVPGVSATVAGPVITFNVAAGIDFNKAAVSFGIHAQDRSARLQASVRGNQILMAGIGADTGGAYVNVNVGGQTPTFGVFSALAKGAVPPENAQAVAQSVHDAGIPGVDALSAGSQLTITGAQEIECDVTTDIRVGQPTARFCSRCSPCCDRLIGRVSAVRADMDAALIELEPGLEYKAEIEGITGPILGTKPVTASGVPVRKRGPVSLLQHGTILAVNQDGDAIDPDQVNDPPEWVLFSRHYTNAFSIGPGSFSADGDSGAAIVDENTNHIMGLMFAGTEDRDGVPGFTLATPAEPILTAFGVVLDTATTTGAVRTVPGAEAMPATELGSTPVFARALAERLKQARRQLETTETGAEFAVAAERHADEAQGIVNNNLRVAAVWHRNGGPQILQAALNAIFLPDQPLPHEIEGKPITECLQKIQQIFMRYASAAFAADLDRLGPRLIELCGLSYNETLTALGGPEHSE